MGITLTAGIVLRLAALYLVLLIIDGAASYYMSSIGHIMGVHIEMDMRRDAFDHLLKLDHTYYNNTKVGTIMGQMCIRDRYSRRQKCQGRTPPRS